MPLSISLLLTYQNAAHRIKMLMNVGSIMVFIPDRLEEHPTFVVKNKAGSFPHPNVKLLKRYTKSQLKMTM